MALKYRPGPQKGHARCTMQASILILRRTYPELREENHILPGDRPQRALPPAGETDKSFTFANGGRIKFGYCDSGSDLLSTRATKYGVIFLDEDTQLPEEWFKVFTACLRGANPFPKRMYLTCNPGGSVGHEVGQAAVY